LDYLDNLKERKLSKICSIDLILRRRLLHFTMGSSKVDYFWAKYLINISGNKLKYFKGQLSGRSKSQDGVI
jgi:hypothetical protein